MYNLQFPFPSIFLYLRFLNLNKKRVDFYKKEKMFKIVFVLPDVHSTIPNNFPIE